MDKETARNLLQRYIDTSIALYGSFTLPIDDVILRSYIDKRIDSYNSFILPISDRPAVILDNYLIEDFTWKFLIQIAYS